MRTTLAGPSIACPPWPGPLSSPPQRRSGPTVATSIMQIPPLGRICSGVRPAPTRPGLQSLPGTRRFTRTISQRPNSMRKRVISRRSSGEAANSLAVAWPLVAATTIGSADTHRPAMSAAGSPATCRSRACEPDAGPRDDHNSFPAQRRRYPPGTRGLAARSLKYAHEHHQSSWRGAATKVSYRRYRSAQGDSPPDQRA
jgi:hypothetical protein